MNMRLEERLSRWAEHPEDEADDDYGLIIDESVTAEATRPMPPKFNKAGSCSLLPSSTIMSPSALLPANLHALHWPRSKTPGAPVDVLQRYVESADNENYDDLVLPEEEHLLDKQLRQWKTPTKLQSNWAKNMGVCVEVTMSGATAVEFPAVVEISPTAEDWVMVTATTPTPTKETKEYAPEQRKSTPRTAAMALGLGLVQPVRAVLSSGSKQRMPSSKPRMADWQHVEIPPNFSPTPAPTPTLTPTQLPPQNLNLNLNQSQSHHLNLNQQRHRATQIHHAQIQHRPTSQCGQLSPSHSHIPSHFLQQPPLSQPQPQLLSQPHVQRSAARRPILIKSAQRAAEPVVVGCMRYDPISRVWVGNEEEGSRFANAIAESERQLSRARANTLRTERLIDTDKLARKISQRSGNPAPLQLSEKMVVVSPECQAWCTSPPAVHVRQPASPLSPGALEAATKGRPVLIPPSAAVGMVGQTGGRARPIFDPQNLRWIDPNETQKDPSGDPFRNIAELPVEPKPAGTAYSGRMRSSSESIGSDNRNCFTLTDEQIEAYQRESAEYEAFARHWFPKSAI
ncbi:hypothetical protein LPJ66_000798 [Kickxella alabastrina]|uniref:Uncharacterized protein n=1 Tax=Kickxella alabastrina TaxID=61397 RepID=A0ACC1IV38_9FUNG|nr:hypothetical protein LPJ66_000798 [Kickxella alabastrina]